MGTNSSPLESSLVWGFVRGVVLRFTTKFSSVVSCSRLRRSLFVGVHENVHQNTNSNFIVRPLINQTRTMCLHQ